MLIVVTVLVAMGAVVSLRAAWRGAPTAGIAFA